MRFQKLKYEAFLLLSMWLWKKKATPVRLHISKVKNWLVDIQNNLGLAREYVSFRTEMKQHVVRILERLDVLENAELVNPNVPLKARQIIDAQRSRYIRTIKEFIEKISIPDEYSLLHEFSEDFSDKVTELVDNTQKSVFVLKEFYDKETGAVAKCIGNMDKSISSLRRTFEKLGLADVQESYDKIEEYYNVLSKRDALEKKLKEKKADLLEPSHKLEKINMKIAEMQSSHGYRFVQEAEKEIEEKKDELEKKRVNIKNAFSPLARPLRKFAKQSMDEKLINNYLKSVDEALEKDESLNIVSVLEKLSEKANSLGLKDAQAVKVKEACKKLSHAWLEKKRAEIRKMCDDLKKIEDRARNDTTRMLIAEQERWQQSTRELIAEIEKDITIISDEFERLNPKLYLMKVRDAIRKIKPDSDVYT